jgi:hypothetical protein
MAERDIQGIVEAMRAGRREMERGVWRKVLNRLYRGEEERVRIEIKIIEAIKR